MTDFAYEQMVKVRLKSLELRRIRADFVSAYKNWPHRCKY